MAEFMAVITSGNINKAMLINYFIKLRNVDIVSSSEAKNRDGSYTVTSYLAVERGIAVDDIAKLLIFLMTKYKFSSLKIRCKNYEIEIKGFNLEQTIELLDNIIKTNADCEKNEMPD